MAELSYHKFGKERAIDVAGPCPGEDIRRWFQAKKGDDMSTRSRTGVRVRHTNNPLAIGWSGTFNTTSLSEVIVQYDEGDADSVPMGELEVLTSGVWKPMRDAFREGDLLPDDHNVRFRHA